MHNLRNGTKNEQVRNALDELTCYLEHPEGMNVVTSPTTMTTPPRAIRQPYTSTKYEDLSHDDNGYMYDQRQDVNSLPMTQGENSYIRHLFQIPLEELPCPQSLHGPTETTNRIEMTPAEYPFFVSNTNGAYATSLTSFSLILFVMCLLSFT
ncbi:hypothetical protein CBL_01405 [Carabus blaptoides fortunei]